MKPRNKYEKKIQGVFNSFNKGLTAREEKQLEAKILTGYVIYKWKRCYCTECNHKWKDNWAHVQMLAPTSDYKCPNCKRKLKVWNHHTTDQRLEFPISKLHIYKGYQIYSVWMVYKFINHNKKPEYSYNLIQRIIIDPSNGKVKYFARRKGYNYWISHGYSVHSDMSLKHYIIDIPPFHVFNENNVIQKAWRNGYDTWMSESYYWYNIIHLLLTNPVVETIAKTEIKPLIMKAIADTELVTERWPSIKICLRHHREDLFGFHCQDWFDHIDMLEDLGEDILNPKNIAPKDFEKAHREINTRINRKRQKELRERERQREIKFAKINKEKLKKMQLRAERYGDLVFKKTLKGGKKLRISVLKTRRDYLEEGRVLNHCVSGASYYFNFQKLHMSATIDNVKTETVEICLRYFNILQARGYDNFYSDYHDEIVNLVDSNLDQIKQAFAKKATRKKKTNKLKVA